MLRKKTGSILDLIGLLVFMFVLVVAFVSFGVAEKKTANALEDIKDDIPLQSFNDSADLVIERGESYSTFWDFLLVFIMFGVWLIIFITSFILGNNPLFLVIYFMLFFVFLLVGLILGFAADEFFTSPSMLEFSMDYPITVFVMRNLLYFALFFGLTVGGALYIKRGG
jgi:hypothetical protein